MEPVIRINQLTKRYTYKILALKGISLEVEMGECVGFLGPNGAGKSTTIKILSGLIRPTSGEAYINGHDVTKNKKKALRSVGCVVETPDFYPYLTPEDTLRYLGKLRGVENLETRIDEVLETVKLGDWKDTRVGSFSKGMKQRLGIGQALLHDPDLIIFDEPTSGLDPIGMAEVRDLINKLKKEKTILLSSHMLPEVQQTADKVALINKGEIMAYDTLESLSRQYFTVKEVIIETLEPLTDSQMAKIEAYRVDNGDSCAEVQSVTKVSDAKYSLLLKGQSESCRADLLKWLVEESMPISSFNPKGLALESIYMEMIK